MALLLTRLYAPTAGHVFLDGYDIATLDPVWLRRVVGVITQEPLLLSGTGEIYVYIMCIIYRIYVSCLYRAANT